MSHFSQILNRVVEKSFDGKQTVIAKACGLDQTEISRLMRQKSPVTSEKLEKLLAPNVLCQEDREMIAKAVVKDFFPPDIVDSLTKNDGGLREDTPFDLNLELPISPRALQVLKYLLLKAQSDPDVVQALELVGKFLELPDPC